MQELFFILLVIGLLLTGAEIFLPGGIMGICGALALLGAIGVAFQAYPEYAWLIAFGIVMAVIASFFVWLNVFPRTGVGRRMSLESSTADYRSTEEGLEPLLEKTGVTTTDCRPAGYATVDGRRVDVVTEGQMIDEGARVRVIRIEGNRVVVREWPA